MSNVAEQPPKEILEDPETWILSEEDEANLQRLMKIWGTSRNETIIKSLNEWLEAKVRK